uniref:60S ribosomal protein L37a n=1 Tax=Falco tinnunculus TaxID=100819 RepID=A0A8C4UT56_FALTI
MAKRTKKVGIVGKYGTRYGASLRKMVKKIEISQHAKYTCSFCGKVMETWSSVPSTHSGCYPKELWFRAICPGNTNNSGVTLAIKSDQNEEEGCGYLALWIMHEDSCWWCLDLQYHLCSDSQICHQKTEGIERPVEATSCPHCEASFFSPTVKICPFINKKVITEWNHGVSAKCPALLCGGLTLAGCQVPTKAALSLPFSGGQRRENIKAHGSR